MTTASTSNDEQVFERPASAARGRWLIFGGLAGLCLAALGFAVAVFGRTGPVGLHGMTTLPTILSVAALTAGWSMVRAPQRVVVSSEGLTVETDRGERYWRWDEVGCGTVQAVGTSQRKQLNVTDVRGKSMVKLDESFERFDELVALVSRRVEGKGDDTADRILRKKAKRQAALAAVFGVFMAFACGFVAWTTFEGQRLARLLQGRGQPGEAEIVRRFIAPNGVTKRVEYRVVGREGRAATRNVEVDPDYWDELKGAGSVPVTYVPDEPAASRLMEGEVIEDDLTKSPAGAYGLAAVGGAFALFMLAASPFFWNGYDLSQDSKTKKWSVKRFGKVVWSSGGAKGP